MYPHGRLSGVTSTFARSPCPKYCFIQQFFSARPRCLGFLTPQQGNVSKFVELRSTSTGSPVTDSLLPQCSR